MNTEKKPLENFHFYRNARKETTVDDVVAEYNLKYPDRPITEEDVRFGPNFHDFGSPDPDCPAICSGGFHFRYLFGDDYSEGEFPAGIFIYSKETKPENLAEVLEEFEQEKYLERLSVSTSWSNEYELIFVTESKIIEFVRSLCAEHGWEFEAIADERRGLGHLTAEGFDYLLKEELFPSRLTLYDKDGKRLNLIKESEKEKHHKVLDMIGKPISEELERQEKEFFEYWGDVD